MNNDNDNDNGSDREGAGDDYTISIPSEDTDHEDNIADAIGLIQRDETFSFALVGLSVPPDHPGYTRTDGVISHRVPDVPDGMGPLEINSMLLAALVSSLADGTNDSPRDLLKATITQLQTTGDM